jgi:hypothetical protein
MNAVVDEFPHRAATDVQAVLNYTRNTESGQSTIPFQSAASLVLVSAAGDNGSDLAEDL